MTTAPSDIMGAAARQLESAGIEAGRLEARRLFEAASGWTVAEIISRDGIALQATLRERYAALVERRCHREPMAHIIGTTPFHTLSLKTDKRALVPRSDSECLVETGLACAAGIETPVFADLGTGTGCLLLSLLAANPSSTGIGIDVSGAAITLAEENAERTNLAARSQFVCLDWQDWTDWARMDVIVSNPPYIASDIIETLDPEVRCFDPRLALDGGTDGLEAYRSLIPAAAEQMRSGAWLVFEIGYDQGKDVTELMQAADFESIGCHTDLAGCDRVVFGRHA